MQLLLGVQHDGTTPQLPTELQQVTTPPWGMDRLRTKTTKVLTSPATSQPLQFYSEEVVTFLNTRAQQETHSPLTAVREGERHTKGRASRFRSDWNVVWFLNSTG